MAITRKVVTVKIDHDRDAQSNSMDSFEKQLKDALDTALGGGDWIIRYMEKRVAGSGSRKTCYLVVAETPN